jgi:hypothetical protein
LQESNALLFNNLVVCYRLQNSTPTIIHSNNHYYYFAILYIEEEKQDEYTLP